MCEALQRLAAIASTLKEAELRTALQLTARAKGNTATASSRQLARATNLSRKNVQIATHSLHERGVITTDGGTATLASTYHLHFLDTAVLPERGVITTPPQPEQRPLYDATPGVVTTPPLASNQRHPGVVTTPPANKEPRARARRVVTRRPIKCSTISCKPTPKSSTMSASTRPGSGSTATCGSSAKSAIPIRRISR